MSKMYIMCGLPGGGKSTWAKKCAQDSGAVIISKDALRAMAFGFYLFDKEREPLIGSMHRALVSDIATIGHTDIIIDETNITVGKRHELILSAKINGLTPVIVWCKGGGNHLKNRMTDPRGYTEEKWREVIDGMTVKFEVPTSDECELMVVE